jgi:hypothetical protein
VKGATEMLADEMQKLAVGVLRRAAEDDRARRRLRAHQGQPEAALPFMALGAIINANNAGLPRISTSRSTAATSTGRRSRSGQSSASSAT